MLHYEQDMPFEVPQGWVWTTLESCTINRDNERIPVASAIRSKQQHKKYDYYGAAGIIDKVDNYIFNERLLLVGEDGANLLSRAKNNAFFAEGKFWVNNHAHILDSYPKKVLDFVAIVINSMNLEMYISGSAQPKLSQDNLNRIPIPLPPLAEQQRIVAEIERWFSLIDTIEQGKENLQNTIKQTKNKILDLAIHGKLVPQDPSDEPASELLKRINPKAQITCDNEHSRKLPYNWSCISHNSIIELSGGSQPPKRKFISKPTKGYIRLFQIRDYGKNPLPVYIPNVDAVKQTHKGDILLARYGGSLGKVFIAENGAYNVAMTKVIFKQPQLIDKMFAFFYYHSRVYQDKLKEISRTAQAGFNSGDFEDLYFPLPPLAEQKRIVRKIEDLFTLINIIEMELAE